MAKVTTDDILNFNRLYFKYKSFAQVARETGFSASTVSKYVDRNWKPIENKKKIFELSMMPESPDLTIFRGIKDFGELCILSEEETKEIKELWDEMEI